MAPWWSSVARLQSELVGPARVQLGDRDAEGLLRSTQALEHMAKRLDALPRDRSCSVLVMGAGTAALLSAAWVKRRTDEGASAEVVTLDRNVEWLDTVEQIANKHDLKLSVPTPTKRFRKTWFQPRRFDLVILDAGLRDGPIEDLDWALFATKEDAELLVGFWSYAPLDDEAGRWTIELARGLCRRGYELQVLYRGEPSLVAVRHAHDMDDWAGRVTIEADLSRADWLLLADICRNRSVVEVGSGGSTAMLARVASELVSYETDQRWFLAVRQVLRDRGLCHVDLKMHGKEPDPESSRADVYVVDCASPGKLRSKWVKHIHERRLAPLVLVHDSRRDSPTNDLDWLFRWPNNAVLKSVDFHPGDSNYLAISYRGGKPVRYVNWHSEPNRKLMSP